MNAGEVRGKLMMWGWKGETDQLSACWKCKKTGGDIFYAKWPKSRLERIRRGPSPSPACALENFRETFGT